MFTWWFFSSLLELQCGASKSLWEALASDRSCSAFSGQLFWNRRSCLPPCGCRWRSRGVGSHLLPLNLSFHMSRFNCCMSFWRQDCAHFPHLPLEGLFAVLIYSPFVYTPFVHHPLMLIHALLPSVHRMGKALHVTLSCVFYSVSTPEYTFQGYLSSFFQSSHDPCAHTSPKTVSL